MRVEFSFDDGAKEDMRLAELFNKYGLYDVIFYIPSDWKFVNEMNHREPLDESDVLVLDKFFEIGSHSITHPMLTRIPFEEAQIEIEESKNQLEYLLGHKVDSFCYPRGYANDELRAEVKKHYKTARNTLVGSITKSKDPMWISTSVHAAGVKRKEYESVRWLDEAYRLLDEAVNTKDSVYHVWGHSWELTKFDGWYDLEKLLKSIKEVA